MGLFNKKNPNETAYVEGKKHFADVIKNSGEGEYLIWRQPEEDFNTNSTLIVMPGEAAIFINNGVIEQVFENGRYQLSTQNYPFISRLRNSITGGISSFNCVVYFVRKAVSRELLWGTLNRIQVRDKLWQIRTDVGARGAYKVLVDNPGVFLERLVGNNTPYRTQNEVFDYFGEELQSKIISALSSFLNEWPGELLGLEAHLQELSATIRPAVDTMLRDYGLKCESFVISGLSLDTSKYDRIDESQLQFIAAQRKAQAEKVAKLTNAEGDAGVFAILGENWARLKSAGILETLAANPGAGGVASVGAGLGVGMAAGSAFSNLANQMFTSYPGANQQPVREPSYQASGRFVQEGAQPQPPANAAAPAEDREDPMAALQKLKALLDQGILPQHLYDEKVKEIVDRMIGSGGGK